MDTTACLTIVFHGHFAEERVALVGQRLRDGAGNVFGPACVTQLETAGSPMTAIAYLVRDGHDPYRRARVSAACDDMTGEIAQCGYHLV